MDAAIKGDEVKDSFVCYLGIPNEAYTRILCPVHIGWGDADQVVSREESEAVATLLPAGHLRVVAGVPHGIEQSEQQVADYIREVLK